MAGHVNQTKEHTSHGPILGRRSMADMVCPMHQLLRCDLFALPSAWHILSRVDHTAATTLARELTPDSSPVEETF